MERADSTDEDGMNSTRVSEGAKSLLQKVESTLVEVQEATALDWSRKRLEASDGTALAELVTLAVKLNTLSLAGNDICENGEMAGLNGLCEMLKVNTTLQSINLSENNLTNFGEDMSGIIQIAEALKVNKTLQSIDVDGHPLPIKQLKGDVPTESIDLSNKRLNVASAVIIASLIGSNSVTKSLSLAGNFICYDGEMAGLSALCQMLEVNTTLKSINVSWNEFRAEGAKVFAEMLKINTTLQSVDLSNNQLCGINEFGVGRYTAEGIIQIAEALKVNSTLQSIDLNNNSIGAYIDYEKEEMVPTPEGPAAIAEMLKVNKTITSISLSGNALCGLFFMNGKVWGTYTAEGIIQLAETLKVNKTLTSISLLKTHLDVEGANSIVEVAKDKPQLITLCGLKPDQTSADFSEQGLGAGDAILLAFDLKKNSFLVELNLLKNNLGREGVNSVVEVAKDKPHLITLCGLKPDQTSADFSKQRLEVGDAILLALDLKKNLVLVYLNLSGNMLCGLTPNGRGTYTSEGIMQITEALKVNNTLQSIE